MKYSLRINTLAAVIGISLAGAGWQAPLEARQFSAAPQATSQAPSQSNGVEVYIVEFVEDGLISYKGDSAGLAATAPASVKTRKLDSKSPAAVAYSAYLESQRAAYIGQIDASLGRNLAVTHSYSVTLNGLAAEMSAAEAAQVALIPGVKSVKPAGVEELVTYRGPKFIGADKIWDGTSTPSHVGTKGKGIVAGVLDGGTNSSHPSFANDTTCDFSPTNRKLKAVDCSTSSGGLCNGPDPEANPGYGHGVHTSSTVAGNTVDNTDTPAPALPDGYSMSGVAPCAKIINYKVCATNNCGGADILAGIQNAITDQVDLINFSISGGTSPWNDNDRQFLDAVNADVFVAAAAGNNSQADPTVVGKVAHRGPWVLTVAATTQDQIIGPKLSAVGGPPATQDVALTPGSTTTSTPTFNGKPLKSSTANVEGCTASGAFPANYFADSIAVIRRGTCAFTEKITNAHTAGAIMVLIGNNAEGSISMDTTGAPVVPAFSISQVAGNALIDYANGNPTATANVSPTVVSATQGDVLADFSYRGPTPGNLADLTKPDVSAPGVNIYAATDPVSGQYQFMSGTSMASPHAAGAAALIRSVHPTWSVTEVKSALMTTTKIDGFRENGTTPWNIDDVGSGRVQVDRAAMAGLTLNETYARFLAANPSGGSVNIKELNLPAVRNMNCSPNCTFTRTVTNRLGAPGTWTTSFQGNSGGITASVSPATFTLAPNATQVLTITAAPPPQTTMTAIGFGDLLFSENNGQSPPQHFTVAIKGVGGNPPVDDVIFADGFDEGGADTGSFSENWDAYATGSNVQGQGGWKGWGNSPAAAATVVDSQRVSAPNSIDISGGADLIHEFANYTSGVYTVTAKMYIPAAFSGETYFIFENVYSDTDESIISWSTQVKFDSVTGTLSNESGAANAGSMPFVTNQWADIKLVIDLDSDMQTFSYNGTELYSGSWSQQFPGQDVPGIAAIGSIDLFANGATSVYYDDIKIVKN